MTVADDVKHFALDVGKILKNIVCLALTATCLVLTYFQLFDGVKPRNDFKVLPLVALAVVALLAMAAFDLNFLKFIVGGGASVVTTIVTSVRSAKGGAEVTTTVTTDAPGDTQPPRRRTMLAAAMQTGMARAVPPTPDGDK